MSEIKNYLFGAIAIERQTTSDRQQALMTIEERRTRYVRSADFNNLLSFRPALAKMARGDFFHDERVVKQAYLKSRVIKVFWWNRQGLSPLNSPNEFDSKFLHIIY